MCPWRLGVEAGVFLVALAGRVADVFPSSDALSEMVWLVPVLDGA